MQTEIIRSGSRREVVHIAEGFVEALRYARANFDVLELEIDEDYYGCADFITNGLDIYAIQPVGFSL